jgi:tetratricopeptide (TPR) repeat protein
MKYNSKFRSFFFVLFVLFSNLVYCQIKDIAKKSINSSVTIIGFDQEKNPIQFGSGFVFEKSKVATNFHVVRGCNSLIVITNQDSIKYEVNKVMSLDELNDLAILNIQLPLEPLALSNDSSLEIGDKIYAVGSPKGFSGTFSEGIVSSFRKSGKTKLIQITAPISHGSSGGPILNSKGEVVGVSVSTIEEGQNLNFAIPISYLVKLNRKKTIPISIDSISVIAKQFMIEGNKKLMMKDFKRAVEYYNKALIYDNKLDDAYVKKALANYGQKKYSELLEDLSRAIEINPLNDYAFYLRGIFRYRIHVVDEKALDYFLNNNDFDYEEISKDTNEEGAISDFDSAIEIYPNNYKAYFRKGLVLSYFYKYDEAVNCFYKSIELTSSDSFKCESYYRIACCYLGLWNSNGGDELVKKLISSLNKSIKINPNYLEAISLRASIKRQTEDYYGALDDFMTCNKLSPNSRNSEIAGVKELLNDFSGAISYYTKDINLNGVPKSNGNKQYLADLYWMRGDAKIASNDYKGAIADCSKAIELLEPIVKNCVGTPETTLGRYYRSRGIARNNNQQKELGCIDLSRALNLGLNFVKSDMAEYCK